MSVTTKPTQRLRKCVSSILSLRVTWRKVSRYLVREFPRQVRRSIRKGEMVLGSGCKPRNQSEWYKERESWEDLPADDKMYATQHVLWHLDSTCFYEKSPLYVNRRQYGERGLKHSKQGDLAVCSAIGQCKIIFPGSLYVRDVQQFSLFLNSPWGSVFQTFQTTHSTCY